MKKELFEITFDGEASTRRKDANGFLHVGLSPITKEQVVDYFGIEIPDWKARGLEPTKKYRGYRPADEIQKGAETFNGLPLLLDHHPESAEKPQKDYRVGSLGTDAEWKNPYLFNTLTITDKAAIDAVENGDYRQISCAYRYTPDFTPGEFSGNPYDFVMRDIQGNHVALVQKGRAGPDVIVADSEPNAEAIMANEETIEKVEVKAAEAIGQMASVIAGLHETNPTTGEIVDMTADEDKNAAIDRIIASIAQYVPAEQAEALKGALNDLAYSKPTGDEGSADPVNAEPDPVLDAMNKCGLDAENPDFRKAFAEGIKYGETKEKEEPKKLDSEHESEGAKAAMDSAAIFAEMAERNALAEAASKFIGTFAFDSMTTKDVAVYAAKKLGLAVDDNQAVTALKAYMHNRPVTQAFAMDSAPVKHESQVDKFYGKE